ncbi:MAG: hypothetical protein MRY72_13120 [Aquisalinus sp.]|nr:hypothetical protein [Aquisalinus sp.]
MEHSQLIRRVHTIRARLAQARGKEQPYSPFYISGKVFGNPAKLRQLEDGARMYHETLTASLGRLQALEDEVAVWAWCNPNHFYHHTESEAA